MHSTALTYFRFSKNIVDRDVRAFYFNTRGSSLPPEGSLYVRTMILNSFEVNLILTLAGSYLVEIVKRNPLVCLSNKTCCAVTRSGLDDRDNRLA